MESVKMNEMRDRLIEIFKKINYRPYPNTMEANMADQFSDYALEHIVNEFLKNGVIVPPVKYGDTLYVITECSKIIVETIVIGVWLYEKRYTVITIDGNILNDSFGKTVFLTKEEAEQALRKEYEGK